MARNSRRVRESSRNAPSTVGGHHGYTRFVDAPCRHALMGGFDHHGDAFWLQHLLDAIGDLRVHLLLHLKAARIGVHHAGELGNADDLPGGEITDMGAADDRRKMMLAMGLKPDIAQHDHLVITLDLFEGALEENDGIVGIAGKPIVIGPRHPCGRIAQALAARTPSRRPSSSVRTADSACSRDGLDSPD